MSLPLQQHDNDQIWDKDVGKDKEYFSNKYYANIRILSNIIGSDKKWIADIGSGNGLADIDLMKLGHTVTALDFSKKSIDLAIQNYDKSGYQPAEIFHQDFMSNTLESDKYDVAISYGVIEHFYDDGKKRFISEMLRIVKPGGFVVIEQPNKACVPFTIMQRVSKIIGTWKIGFENDNNQHEIRALLTGMGIREKDFDFTIYNKVNGLFYIPILKRFVKPMGLDTLENHMAESDNGYCLLYVIKKPIKVIQRKSLKHAVKVTSIT